MNYNRALAVFLTARLDEDAASAGAAGDDETEWRFDGRVNPPRIEGASWESSFHSGIWNCDDPDDDCWEFRLRGENTGEHIARHDPARVLREVEAKRAILRRCERQAEEHDENPNALTEDRTWVLWPVLFDLAAVYRDHPDYQPKWAPKGEET